MLGLRGINVVDAALCTVPEPPSRRAFPSPVPRRNGPGQRTMGSFLPSAEADVGTCAPPPQFYASIGGQVLHVQTMCQAQPPSVS